MIIKRGTKVIDIYGNKGFVCDDIENKICVIWEIDDNGAYWYDEDYIKKNIQIRN
jgi:hypothetical protein